MDEFGAMELAVKRKYASRLLSDAGVCCEIRDCVNTGEHRFMADSGEANTRF